MGDREKMTRQATTCHKSGHLSDKAKAYLVDWITGIRRREPRPERYTFLDHLTDRSQPHNCAEPSPSALPLDASVPPWDRQPRPIEVEPGYAGAGSEAEDEAEPEAEDA